ncbi:MAG: hypothetical protein ACFB03_24210 [Paracoccaceae bacterium]
MVAFPNVASSEVRILPGEIRILDAEDLYPENRDGRRALEACVSRRGLVDQAIVRPRENTTVVEVEVSNVLSFEITGLLVQPIDSRLPELNLDGRNWIKFDPLQPGETFTYVEETGKWPVELDLPASLKLVAWEVVDGGGKRIVEHVYGSRWPHISSEADLEFAQRELCHDHGR